jgi:branched-chain amino acid transport system permease protein
MSMFSVFCVAFLYNSVGLPLLLSILGGIVSAIIIGFLVDFLIILRAKKVDNNAKQIITLGLIMVFMGLAPKVFSISTQSLPRIIPSGDLSIAGASISYNAILNIVVGLAIMGGLFYALQKTKLGLAVRTTASNESTARLMGVSTRTITMMAWCTAGALGVLSGVMIAPATSVSIWLMNPIQVAALFACVLGGFQTFYGPVIGAYVIAIMRNMLSYYVSSVWGEQILYLLILVLLIILPNGLVGKKLIKKV